MPVPNKQKLYVKRHQQKTDTVTVRPQKGIKEQWRSAANALGVSLQRFVIDSVNNIAAAVLSDSAKDNQ